MMATASQRADGDLTRRTSDGLGRIRKCGSGLNLVLSGTSSPALSRCNSEPGSPRAEPLSRFVSDEDILLTIVRARLTHFHTNEDETALAASASDELYRREPSPIMSHRVEKRRASEALEVENYELVPQIVFRRRGAISITEPCENMRKAYDQAKRFKML